MKYSFMSFSCPEATLDETLSIANRSGYDAIEPRVEEGHKHGIELDAGPEKRKEIKDKVAGSTIKFSCLATSCQYVNPADTKKQIDDTRRYVDLAADIGAPRIRVFGGLIPEEVGRPKATAILVKTLRFLGAHASQRGVSICVETHDDWSHPSYMAEVMNQVQHPAVKVNWDIMHSGLWAGQTIDFSFQTLRPWIDHIHFHDAVRTSSFADKEYKIELRPIGQGSVDHRRTVKLLQGIPYAGYLSGEWICWEHPYEIHLPRELAAMKSYENS